MSVIHSLQGSLASVGAAKALHERSYHVRLCQGWLCKSMVLWLLRISLQKVVCRTDGMSHCDQIVRIDYIVLLSSQLRVNYGVEDVRSNFALPPGMLEHEIEQYVVCLLVRPSGRNDSTVAPCRHSWTY